MTKLNPCPDCGGEPDFEERGTVFRVACWHCNSTEFITARTANGAVSAWNAATSESQSVSTEKTLRDEFAMAAIGGYMATESCLNSESAEWAVAHSYEIADLMLKEREK